MEDKKKGINMFIKRIGLDQNKSSIYTKRPLDLDTDYNSSFDFMYPLSYILALDCERIVFKIIEYNIQSNICDYLRVVFVSEESAKMPYLTDFIDFDIKKKRFVNVYMNPEKFNKMDDNHKREIIIEKICEALSVVSEKEYHYTIAKICKEVYVKSDDTECLYKKINTKKYNVEVRFKSSLDGYKVFLYVSNLVTKHEFKYIIFEKCSYSDLSYRINKLIIKENKCILYPKKNSHYCDNPIEIEINCT